MEVGQAGVPSWTTTDKEETGAWGQEPPAGLDWARPAARSSAMPQGYAPQAYACAPQAQVQDENEAGVAGVGDGRARTEEAGMGGHYMPQGAPPRRPPSPAAPAPVTARPMPGNPQPHAPQTYARPPVSERLEALLMSSKEGDAERGDMMAWHARQAPPPQHPPAQPTHAATAAPQPQSPNL